MIASVCTNSQSISLASLVVDSIIWKLNVGAICDSLQSAQLYHVTKLQTELLTQGKIIQLKKSEVTHLEEIIAAIQKDFSAVKTIKDEKIHSLKVRIRKLTFMLIGETGLIVLMVVLLL